MKNRTKWLCMLFLMGVFSVFAQQKNVTGTVTDFDGVPLPGVNVIVESTTNGTQTDFDGNYAITVSYGQILVFTYLGLRTERRTVGDQNVINIQLQEDAEALDEVVVVGFGTQIKRKVTDNIAKIEADQIGGIATPSFQAALIGKAPGVQITQTNGKLDGGLNITIRGLSSVTASQQPLFVIDGIEMNNNDISSTTAPTNPLLALNPNDIASIDILKDASAAAIFGAKGTNGVILITTKRGNQGKSVVSLDVSTSYGEPSNTRDWLNGEDYIELLEEAEANTNFLADRGLTVDGLLQGFAGDQDFRNVDTDWQDFAFQDSYVQNVNLSVSGGNEKTRSFISGAYTDNEGIIRGNTLERYTVRANIDHKVNDWLKLGLNSSYASTVIDRISSDASFLTPMQAIAQIPTAPAFLSNGDINSNTLYANFLLQDRFSFRTSKQRRLLGKVFAEIKLMEKLRFQTELGYDYLNQTVDRNTGRLAPFQSTNGQTFASDNGAEIISTNNYMTYDTTFGEFSNFAFVLGSNFTRFKNRTTSVTGDGFPTDDFKSVASAAQISAGDGTFTNWAQLSYFARATYDYKGKYLFKASIRRDGSSRFGAENQFGYFPAASAGWIISEEDFLSESSILSYLKLRGSWGINGNTPIANFGSLGLFGGASYNGESALEFTQGANPDLKWEETEQINFGLDFGFLNNRISGEVDYYKKKTKDLLFNTRVPFEALLPSHRVLQNIGNLENEGFEFSLNTINIQTQNLTWKTNLNFAINKNKITNLPNGEDLITVRNILREGEPINSFFLLEYAGVDPANGDALYVLNTENPDGSMNKNTTNDPTAAERIVAGNPNPDVIAGLSSNFNYKSLDFSFTFQGQWGGQRYNNAGRFQEAGLGNGLDNQDQYVFDRRWQNPGDITDVPQARLFENNGHSESTRYMQDADFIRLRNITIGYSLPQQVLDRIGMSRVRIYTSGLNLLTFTDYRGYDPESSDDSAISNTNSGTTFYSAPQARVYTLGLNLAF
ncbi:SusC/RagA family TonB-linked outer membrane protein [Croceitalea rosinachiae]|uniref:TonB-dependent receptor n=1 Tax=Croceitalea rosinachiae TaxID=3075596 RepID=A0ABU3ADB8_9FLAO|nr:TonB-dependent receptor [Croceitalea sp. F388]MDT0608181.1 TonB-dependent receptor [Croceitalea sp. F388]